MTPNSALPIDDDAPKATIAASNSSSDMLDLRFPGTNNASNLTFLTFMSQPSTVH
jgi:hypothetical protein